MIINSKQDLRRYIDNAFSNWTFESDHASMIDAMTSDIWMGDTPDTGSDWFDFLTNDVDWQSLIDSLDGQ